MYSPHAIDAARERAGVSKSQLCRMVGLPLRTYTELLTRGRWGWIQTYEKLIENMPRSVAAELYADD